MARVIEIATPLEKDVLLFHTMRATEEMSRLFEYELELFSLDGEIDLDGLLGKSFTIALERADGEIRHFNGLCSRVSQGGKNGRFFVYHATVRPWLWFLTRTKNYRIFQEKTVPEILKETFDQHSAIANVEFELSESYTPWVYCVQYNESDFAFVSRLMEHEGIYYFFKHIEGKHTLVIADSYSAHAPCYQEEVPFIAPQERIRPEQEHVSEWSISRELQPGKYALASYDFEKPSVDLQVRSSIKRSHELAEYEVFEYGGDYVERGDGELYARTRIEEVQSKYERTRALTNARGMTPGFLFNLSMHPRTDQNAEYLVISAEYELRSGEHEGSDTPAAEYICRFTALNSKQPFRAERITPKPVVQGPQTALVVGPGEIHTDNYGRVKVHFYWDRKSQRDDKSSCWIRVSQNWGGKGWGGMFIPHVGQEVIVQFEGGDPDLPLITGRVYNAENMPPVELPAGKTKSIIRDHGANEITMEGDGGKQRITMFSPHATTTFSMGAPNSPSPGFFFKTDEAWAEYIDAHKETHVTKDTHFSCKANSYYFVEGNYITQVHGYQEYSTYGHYMTKVLGANWVIIVGADTDIYFSSQQVLNVGLHLNVYANVRYQLEKSVDVFKTPFEKYMAAQEKMQVGESMQKFGELREQVVGTLRQDANQMRQNAANMSFVAKSLAKLKAAALDMKASKVQWEADKMEVKGTKKFTKGDLKVNNVLKCLT